MDEPARCTNGHAQRETDSLERLAELLAERLDYGRLAEQLARFVRAQAPLEPTERGTLVSAAELARLTGMSPRWVYDHARELGVHKTGKGPRPRLRFDPALALAKLAARDGDEASTSATALTPRALPASVPLLPVRGEGGKAA